MSELTPQQLENEPDIHYLETAHDVVKKAAENAPGTTERFNVVDSYVNTVLADAEKGVITGSAGTYTKEVLLKQFDAFLREVNNPHREMKDSELFMLIPRANGLRESVKLLIHESDTYRDFEASLALHIADQAGTDDPLEEAQRVARELINPQPSEQLAPVQETVKEETELEMYERFYHESKTELEALYAEHRQFQPGSQESLELENRIKYAKEDAGKYAREVAKLKGSTVWH